MAELWPKIIDGGTLQFGESGIVGEGVDGTLHQGASASVAVGGERGMG